MRIKFARKIVSSLLIFILFFGWVQVPIAGGATLSTGSLLLSDSRPSNASTSYTLTFSNVTTSAINCIKVVFATTASGSSVPTGLSTAAVAFDAASNYIPTPASWIVNGTGPDGTVTLKLVAGETPAAASARTIVLTGITNSSVVDTAYYAQVSTFSNVNCSTGPVDSGIVAFINTTGQAVSATVDPSLTFTVNAVASGTVNEATVNITTTATTIPFGSVTSASNKIGAQDLTVGTNAAGGYTITTKYTGILTNAASNTIDDFTGTNSAPATFFVSGTEAFGYTTQDASLGTGTATRFTSSGGNKWAKFTTSPLEVVYSAAAASETTRVGFQVGVAATTEAGTYTTTVVYTATPIY
jgi:hypothetical protein